MDALSEAFAAVRMTGAIFFNAECTSPWGFRVPAVCEVAHLLAPGTERIVGYHLITEGKAIVRFRDECVPISAGDLLINPHGEAHTVEHGSPATYVDSGATLGQFLAGTLTEMTLGGGGEMTRFVCGYFGCERDADRLFLAGLPAIIQVNLRSYPAGAWLESSLRHLVGEAGQKRPGQSVLLAKMAEALFIEALRRYMEDLPPEQTGWLAGARDPVVGGALALMHRQPFHPWSLAELAVGAGASRSVLAERFMRFLGEPPLTYLARWRLQLAARLLQTTRRTVLQIAAEVGYDSEAAFNRAFKRGFGVPPGQFRRATSGSDLRLVRQEPDRRAAAGRSRARRPMPTRAPNGAGAFRTTPRA
ncbi:MAG: AraC family transcriptional regulator [Bauldia sp.]|nr:AraC family transcriptional regulator [Bauldia sp.]